jgi:hypothetical protein
VIEVFPAFPTDEAGDQSLLYAQRCPEAMLRRVGSGLGELAELLAYEEHPLQDGDPGHRGEEVDRPLE